MIGVLALQGNYQMHRVMLDSIGQENILVRSSKDLACCNGLIIPGGESTVISKLLIRYGLLEPIKNFAKTKGVFGTCAGLILMTGYSSENIRGLDILNVDVSRNAWGRQIYSFTESLNIDIFDKMRDFKATFIRAPKINSVGDSVKTLSYFKKEPVMVRQHLHLATTFHPEMHADSSIHKYFIDIINANR